MIVICGISKSYLLYNLSPPDCTAARIEVDSVALALTATEDGERCFAKLGFQPSGYEEAWVKGDSDSSPVLIHMDPDSTHKDMNELTAGKEILSKAAMAVKYYEKEQTF